MGMAERIKERRLIMKYTQEELAEKLGLQKSAIAKYENGRVENIKRSVIAHMASILECSPAYLMGWSEDTNTNQPILMTKSEEDHLMKYRSIDDKGRHTVDTILLMEYNRCEQEQSKISPITQRDRTHLQVNAAHQRTDIEVTDEMKQFDDAFFDE